jgi:hypothetical protein
MRPTFTVPTLILVEGHARASHGRLAQRAHKHARFTDTWVKVAGGKWLCVASQDSPVKK